MATQAWARSEPVGTDPTRAGAGEDLVTVALGCWLILGLFSDGWAHVNRPGLESFFTPWHGALYSGFVASAAWVGWLGYRHLRLGRPPRVALPVGYGWGALGVVVFGLGGVADMLWHLALGVEAGLDALLSPTHLMLLTGGFLLLTAAARSTWSRIGDGASATPRAQLPAVLSVALATALTAFFLLYLSAFTSVAPSLPHGQIPEGAPGHEASELTAIVGLGAFLVTTAVIVIPVLVLMRQRNIAPGAVTIIVSTVAWLSAAVEDFPAQAVAGAVAVTLAALAADAILVALDRRRRVGAPARFLLAGVVVPTLVWPARLIGLELTGGVQWSAELVTGVVVLTALGGAVLGQLVQPHRPAGGQWGTVVSGHRSSV